MNLQDIPQPVGIDINQGDSFSMPFSAEELRSALDTINRSTPVSDSQSPFCMWYPVPYAYTGRRKKWQRRRTKQVLRFIRKEVGL